MIAWDALGWGPDQALRGEKDCERATGIVGVGRWTLTRPQQAVGGDRRRCAAGRHGLRRGRGTDSGSGGKDKDGKGSTTAESKQSVAVVTIAPKAGAKDVDTSGTLKVTASKGKLTEVTVKDDEGTKIDGEISADGSGWTPATHLAASTKYQVHAIAKDSEGRTAAEDSSFTTLSPRNTFTGNFTPEDGSKVGVGMPFSVRFTRGITKPDDVEKAIKITTEPPSTSRATGSATTASTSGPRSTGRPVPRSP